MGELLDKADEVIETEGAPAAGVAVCVEVVVGKDGGARFPFALKEQGFFRMVLLRDTRQVERAYRFADGAVGFEIREAVDAGAEFCTKGLKPPGVFERLALREGCAP